MAPYRIHYSWLAVTNKASSECKWAVGYYYLKFICCSGSNCFNWCLESLILCIRMNCKLYVMVFFHFQVWLVGEVHPRTWRSRYQCHKFYCKYVIARRDFKLFFTFFCISYWWLGLDFIFRIYIMCIWKTLIFLSCLLNFLCLNNLILHYYWYIYQANGRLNIRNVLILSVFINKSIICPLYLEHWYWYIIHNQLAYLSFLLSSQSFA